MAVDWDQFDWSNLLRHNGPHRAGATDETVVQSSFAPFHPITPVEIQQVRDCDRNPWLPGTPEYNAWAPTDASGWVFPVGPFPPSYLSLVRWSNGGDFLAGDRRFLRIVGIEGIRAKMFELLSPQYMPRAVPFASNDYYDIYCFDMREPLRDDYPILVTRGSTMNYNNCSLAATSLLEFLQLSHNPRPPRIRANT
jgi:hypothetical protein